MTETRVTSETGGSKGTKLARYDLIPTYPLRLVAEMYGRGLEKYPTEPGEKDNWRKGYHWSLSYAALQRHANAYWSGEEIDPETGIPHLVSVVFHAFSLIEWGRDDELRELFDDRQDVDRTPESFIDWSKIYPITTRPITLEFTTEDINPEVMRLFYGKGFVAPNDDDGLDEERDYDGFEQEPSPCTKDNPCSTCRYCMDLNKDKEVTA